MAHTNQLENYFSATRSKHSKDRRFGVEVENWFVNNDGTAIDLETSQGILRNLVSSGWQVAAKKGDLVTVVKKGTSRIQYELGYPNLELSVCPYGKKDIIPRTRALLEELYRAAEQRGAYPNFAPIFNGDGNYLMIPDERDAAWLRLDGERPLSLLAKTSAVQFTIDVSIDDVMDKIYKLWAHADIFLKRYPQDKVWKEYIRTSTAGYRPDRYGGSDNFDTLQQYCYMLSVHEVVQEGKLVPFEAANLESNEKIALFLRSVWWYFRLRRYGHNLCIEVRPLPRRRDDMLQQQFEEVLDIMG